RKGEGSGFFGVREYRSGDPLRHVHWPTAARVGRLAVVEWEAEESRDSLIAIETRRGAEREIGAGNTLDLAAGLAASLAGPLLTAGDTLRILAPAADEREPPAHRGAGSLPEILELLARMQPVPEVSVAAVLRRLAPRMVPGTLVCWLTAAAEPQLVEAVRYLRVTRAQPVVYALVDTPRGHPSAWDAITRELESLHVPVVRLHPDDDLVRRLIS
ncbi:MAG TPA: DUF58 domain-containing protein, partial [Armatimonadota bacterium]|nr:DUF58 domain-containing protein [Armatimonadota bacterium]